MDECPLLGSPKWSSRSSGSVASTKVKPRRIQTAPTRTRARADELANEGKVVVALRAEHAEEALDIMRAHPLGKYAEIIGHAEERRPFPSVLKNPLGARVILEMPTGEHLPRIC